MLLGRTGALATVHSVVPADARNNLVYVIGGDFGRQLKADGGGGTYHGRENTILVIGEAVRGGVYEKNVPKEELARYAEDSSDSASC